MAKDRGEEERAREDFLSPVSFRFQIAVCSSQYWYRFLGRASHSVYTLGALGKSDYWICTLWTRWTGYRFRIEFVSDKDTRSEIWLRSTNKKFLRGIFMEKSYRIPMFPRDFRDVFVIFSSITMNQVIERKKRNKGLEL